MCVSTFFIEGHKFTSFCNYSLLPSVNKVYYYYYYYCYYYYYYYYWWVPAKNSRMLKLKPQSQLLSYQLLMLIGLNSDVCCLGVVKIIT